MGRELAALDKLRAAGRTGMAIFAACCAERLRPLLHHVPSGAAPLVAVVALTELWRVLEGQQRVDPRRMKELSEACWTLVDIEPVPKIETGHLEILVAATHDALAAAKKCSTVAGEGEPARQDRDIAEIAKTREGLAPLATLMRKRAEADGKAVVRALVEED